jgi:hypothetical protein
MSTQTTKKTVKKNAKRKANLQKALEEQDEFLDNILEQETNIDEMLELPDIVEDENKVSVTLTDVDPDNLPVEQENMINLIPYFNSVESELYQKILSERMSVEYDIQYCIRFILNCLMTYEAHQDIVNRDIVETKILALLDNMSIAVEPFWQTLSWSKDIISYKLNGRCFPTFKLVEAETITEVDPDVVADSAKTRKKKPVNETPKPKEDTTTESAVSDKSGTPQETIAKKYDLGRPGLQTTLNADYVDEGVRKREDGVFMYRVLLQEKYTSIVSYDTIDRIFQLCSELRLYGIMLSLYCRMVASREFCHFILRSRIVMNLLFRIPGDNEPPNPFLDEKYQEIIHNFLFYGLYLMYKEECTVKSVANPEHRFVLDLETIQHLPVYDGPLADNPFIPLTLSNEYLYAQQVPTQEYLFKPLNVSNKERGLYTLHSSQARFRVFTDGIFDGLNWDKLSMTGSVMPAVVIRNPLEKLFGLSLPKDVDQKDPNAARAYWQEHRTELENYFDEYYPSKNILNSGYFNPENPLYENLTDASERLSDIDIIVNLDDDNEFDKKVLEVFETIQTNVTRNHEENPDKYPSDKIKMLKIETPASYKYYIVGPGLMKNIELFRIFVDPLGCVSRFHFPCVRGTYNGDSISVFPSFISAAYTGILIDYKWMSSAKDTKDLVCKYYTRGFTLVLNKKEHDAMKAHIVKHADRWGYLMAANNNSRSISITNPVFKPRQNRAGIYFNLNHLQLKQPPIYSFTPPMANFDGYWEPKDMISDYGFPLGLRFPAGYIKAPELWKVSAYVHSLRMSEKYRN